VTLAARTSPLSRAWYARWPIGVELALFLALMVLYEWLRSVVAPPDDATARAIAHALDVVDLERSLHLFVEPDAQSAAESVPGLKFLTTWFYTLAYTGGFTIMFLWVWFRRREWFASFRNWFWASALLAVVGYWLYPLAPPRLTDLGLEDPTKATLELGGALEWFQPFRNEFAAMPSMHVGQAVLFAVAICWLNRSPWRFLAWLWPAFMLFTVMATANHWWLDGAGGIACILLALLMVRALDRSQPPLWSYRR
jgi:hypothetical protein